MNHKTDELEFDVLGHNVRFKPDGDNEQVPPQLAVELVLKEANDIRSRAPHLENGEVAALVALKLASDHILLQDEYQNNIDKLQKGAIDALHTLEEVSS